MPLADRAFSKIEAGPWLISCYVLFPGKVDPAPPEPEPEPVEEEVEEVKPLRIRS